MIYRSCGVRGAVQGLEHRWGKLPGSPLSSYGENAPPRSAYSLLSESAGTPAKNGIIRSPPECLTLIGSSYHRSARFLGTS